jgi:hypothetical protein
LHPSTLTDLIAIVRRQWFSVIGVSLSCESRIEELAPLLSALRAVSRNASVALMVGGQPFVGHSERVFAVGADGTALDGRLAPQEAERLVAARVRRE